MRTTSKKSKKSPTQRSMEHMRSNGWQVEIVEHFNYFSKRRHDLFGIADLFCIHRESGEMLLVQTTTGQNVRARIQKIEDHENTPIIRKAGLSIHVHGWSKRKAGWILRTENLS